MRLRVRPWPVCAHPRPGPRRCLLCVVPLVVMTGCELNAFLLKRVLWIPPRNALNTCRLCIWVGACSSSTQCHPVEP